MSLALLFFTELFILFLLSRQVTRLLSAFFHRVTKSTKITIYLMSALFFPGTVLHELSHFFMAKLLFVPTHRMELFPKLDGDTLKLGSVAVARTDFLRRFLIGAAPFLIGTSILLGLLYYASMQQLFDNYFVVLLIGYVVFEIGNTMFSSNKDMEGALELLLTLVILTASLYFAGFRLPAINPEVFFVNPHVQQIFTKGSLFLLAPISIDLGLIIILWPIKPKQK